MSPEVADALLSRLYREMQFEYNIDVDKHAITALNKLFSISRESLEDTHTLTDAPWLAAQRYRGKSVNFSTATARLIFEDLFLLGWSPKLVGLDS